MRVIVWLLKNASTYSICDGFEVSSSCYWTSYFSCYHGCALGLLVYMRTLFIIPLVLMSLISSPSWGLDVGDLVIRDGLYYKKFSDVPFTGEVDGFQSA